MSALDEKGLMNVDTVENTIMEDAEYDSKDILALISSRLIGWYTYVFVFNKAIRTMDFDGYYIGKIPVAKELNKVNNPFSDLVNNMLILCSQKNCLRSMFKNLLAILNMTRMEKLSFYVSSPRIATLHAIRLSETSKIESTKIGTIERYHVRLDGDSVEIVADIKEQEASLDIIRLKFDDHVLRDYFYIVLKTYEGGRNYKTPRNLYETTVSDMLVPHYDASNLLEDNPKAIRRIMGTLQKEYEKKKQEFLGSPVVTGDLVEVEQQIMEIDRAIDNKIFQIYGISEDEAIFIKEKSPSLTRAT